MKYKLKNGKEVEINTDMLNGLKEVVRKKRLSMTIDFLRMYEEGLRNDIIFKKIAELYFLENIKSIYTLLDIPYLKSVIDENKI